jgi:hypothetical protein
MIYGYIIRFSSSVLHIDYPLCADINADLGKYMAMFLFSYILVMNLPLLIFSQCLQALQSLSTTSLLRGVIYFDNIGLDSPQ